MIPIDKLYDDVLLSLSMRTTNIPSKAKIYSSNTQAQTQQTDKSGIMPPHH